MVSAAVHIGKTEHPLVVIRYFYIQGKHVLFNILNEREQPFELIHAIVALTVYTSKTCPLSCFPSCHIHRLTTGYSITFELGGVR